MSSAWIISLFPIVAGSLLMWPLFGYGLFLKVMDRLCSRFQSSPVRVSSHDFVTVLLAVHNERDAIEARLYNLLDTELAIERLQILVVSDASTDGTDEVVLRWHDPRVRFVRSEPRGGKSLAQNAALATVKDGIVVITDCGTSFDRRTIPELVAPFADPSVGVVDGALQFVLPERVRPIRAQKSYWSYEGVVRACESRLGILPTASGAVMAVRRELVRELPAHVGDDCVIPLMAVVAGMRVHRAEAALAWDQPNTDPRAEFRSRVRMVVRNWQGTLMFPELLAPWRRPGIAFALWSHKILRWCTPFVVLLLMISLAAAALHQGGRWTWVALTAWTAAAIGLVESALAYWTRGRYRASQLGSFALVCVAFGVGVMKAVCGYRIGGYRDRTSAAPILLVLMSTLALADQGAGQTHDAPASAWETIAVHEVLDTGTIPPVFGLATSTDGTCALVGGGSGESYAGGGMVAIDLASGSLPHPPIDVGRNCCALEVVSGLAVAAWRGSAEISAVDLGTWSLRSRHPLDFMPLGLASVGNQVWVVGADGDRGAIAVFQVEGGLLKPLGAAKLRHSTYRAVFANRTIVVTQPSAGAVAWLDPVDLSQISRHVIGGTPWVIAPWDEDQVLVASREGVLHIVSKTRGVLKSVDLSEVFRLGSGGRVLRDLDPTDLLVLPDRCVLIGMYRVDGCALSLEGNEPMALGRFPAGNRHRVVRSDAGSATILVASRSGLREFTLDRSGGGFRTSPARRIAQTDFVVSWAVHSGKAPSVAVATLGDADVHFCSAGSVRRTAAPPGVGRLSALADGGVDHVLAVTSQAQAWSVAKVSADGSWGDGTVIPGARALGWCGSHAGTILAIDRLQQRCWQISGSSSEVLEAPRPRPRAAARLETGEWIVIHDTSPDVGCSKIVSSRWEDFEPMRSMGWPSAITTAPSGRSAYIVTFDGELVEIGPDLRVIRVRSLGVQGLVSIAVDRSGRIGCASENQSVAVLLGEFNGTMETIRFPGTLGIVPLDGPERLVAVITLSGTRFLRPVPAP